MIFLAPVTQHNVGFADAEEEFLIQQLCPQAGVEAVHISILPRRSWLDVFQATPTNALRPIPGITQMLESLDAIYRAESRCIFATLIRLLGDFDLAEDSMHDAFAILGKGYGG